MGQTSSSTSYTTSPMLSPVVTHIDRSPNPRMSPSTVVAVVNTQQDDVESDLTIHLPHECIAWIFQKLSPSDRTSCSLVCKRWHFIEAKSRERLALNAEAAVDPHVEPIFLRYEFVTTLSLRCHKKSVSIEDKTLIQIGQFCKQLTRLKLKSCKALSDDGLGQFAKLRGQMVKKFSCASCSFASKGLNLLLQNCPKLEDLSVKRLRKLRENPEPILPGKSRLKRLSLKEITSAHLFGTLIAGSKNIQTLVLARNPGAWDHFFKLIAQHLGELIELRLDSLRMGDIALKAISGCSKLEVLHVVKLTDCTDMGYVEIANGCRSLKKLYIDDRRPTPIGDFSLAMIGRCCTKIQELVLIGVNVSIQSLSLIATHCPGLERMALCSSNAVGDVELSCIGEKFVSLKKLCIKNCPISDIGMEGLARGCPSLSKVKVKRCKDITMYSAMLLQINRPSLVVSLDAPPAATIEETEEAPESPVAADAGRGTFFWSRTPLSKTRFAIAASNFLRKFPKPS